MSGPKDYVFVFAIERMIRIQARRQATELQRQARLQMRQEQAQRKAAERAAEDARKRAAKAQQARQAAQVAAQEARQATADAVQKAAEANAMATQNAAKANALRRQRAAIDENTGPIVSAGSMSQADDQPVSLIDQDQVAERWRQLQERLDIWQKELIEDESTVQFQAATAGQWQKRCVQLREQSCNASNIVELEAQSQTLVDEAAEIHKQAGEQQAKFDTRNELLADIIASLQEIGFFVADPHYQNPADPAGVVILKATRGSEEISASVDLGDTIHTVWNGANDETCKQGFFDYLDRMKEKGVAIRATRADLQERPILKHAGAKELPRSQPQQRST